MKLDDLSISELLTLRAYLTAEAESWRQRHHERPDPFWMQCAKARAGYFTRAVERVQAVIDVKVQVLCGEYPAEQQWQQGAAV